MGRRKLRIYSDRDGLAPGQSHVVMLYPFWGKNPETPGAPDTGRFDHYASAGRDLLDLVPLAEADAAVLPGDWPAGGGCPEAFRFCEKANRAGKPVIVFFNNDSAEKIPLDNMLLFRTSAYGCARRQGEFGLPAWCEDFVKLRRGGQVPLRSWQPRPTVGYCGYGTTQGSGMRAGIANAASHIPLVAPLLGSFIRTHHGPAGHKIRSKALRALHRSGKVQTNFLLRKAFWNGAIRNGRFDVDLARRSRTEYIDNMFSSDYVLCARGGGNFSFRFYETFCCGRMPLFVNTDCILPFDQWIAWKKRCVWIEERDLPSIAERLAAFHADLSPAEFENIQRSSRRLWEEWLSPMGFFSNLYRYFE